MLKVIWNRIINDLKIERNGKNSTEKRQINIVLPLGIFFLFHSTSLALENRSQKNLRMFNSCQGCDLRDSNFSKLDLRNAQLDAANLSNSILRSTDFRGASLEGVSLMKADLTASRFQNANLKNAIFDGNIMVYTNFRRAKMEGAKLNNVNLEM